MSSLKQLLKKRYYLKITSKTPRLNSCPQKKGICSRVFLTTPKKPNSALRKVTKLFLPSTKLSTIAYIPGIGHNLQKFSTVLIRGGRVKDLPGVRYKVIRGKFDARPVYKRRQSRSLYGMKDYFNVKKKKKCLPSHLKK